MFQKIRLYVSALYYSTKKYFGCGRNAEILKLNPKKYTKHLNDKYSDL